MKKISLFLSLFLFLSLTGCDSPSISGKKVKKEYFTGGKIRTEFIMDDDTEQNGVLKKYGYNGNVTSTITIRNGVKEGIETWFDLKGRPIRRVPYNRGKIHGTMTELYENGDTFVTIPFINNIKQGTAVQYKKDGSINKKVEYKNGKMVN